MGTALAWYEWNWAAAEREIRRSIEINPNLADVHAGRGDDEAAESLARGYAEGGYQRAMHNAAETLASRFTRRYVHPTAVARLYAYAGEKAKALEWLEKAYDGRDSQLMYLQWHMEWDSLRADSRVQALLRRMKLPVTSS